MPSKEVWIGWISSAVEAYNMAIYSFLAPLLATLVFPQVSGASAIFFSYVLILAASCVLYPAGAIYYGFLGDRLGRKTTCIHATLGLGAATGLMGLIPFPGNCAWICLFALICAQHFFSGGDYHGSVVFSLEHLEQKAGGLTSALSCLFAVFGLAAANGLATLALVTADTFWIRVGFLVGAAGGMLSYLVKTYCRETPAFSALPRNLIPPSGRISFLRSEGAKIGTAVAVLAFFLVSYTFIFIVLPLLPADAAPSSQFHTFRSLAVYALGLVLAGWLADRVGIKKVMLTGLTLFSLAIIPLCHLCDNLQLLQISLTVCACLVIGPIHTWLLHLFEVQSRCRGIFISSAITTSIFGGSTTPICLMLYEKFHSLEVCCIYPLTIALGSMVCLACSQQPAKVQESPGM